MFIMFPSATYNRSQLQSVVIFNEFSSDFVVKILTYLLFNAFLSYFYFYFYMASIMVYKSLYDLLYDTYSEELSV